jgi:hypothetical protein
MLTSSPVSPFSESFNWDDFESFLYRIADEDGYLHQEQMKDIAEDFQMEKEFSLLKNSYSWSVDQFVNFLYDSSSEQF